MPSRNNNRRRSRVPSRAKQPSFRLEACMTTVTAAATTMLLLSSTSRLGAERACCSGGGGGAFGLRAVSAFASSNQPQRQDTIIGGAGAGSSRRGGRGRWAQQSSSAAVVERPTTRTRIGTSSSSTTSSTALGIADSRELRFYSAGQGGGEGIAASSVFASATSTFDAEELLQGIMTKNGKRRSTGNDEEDNSVSRLPASPSLFRAGMASVRAFSTSAASASVESGVGGGEYPQQQQQKQQQQINQPYSGDPGPMIDLTTEERELFDLLTQVVESTPEMTSTLRVAGGWVRDKLLATEEFKRSLLPTYSAGEGEDNGGDGGDDSSGVTRQPGEISRLTSKFLSKSRGGPSKGRHGTKVIGTSSGSEESSSSSSSSLQSSSSSQHTTTRSLLDGSAPVDIDVALDDMLGREFADHLNDWLSEHGRKTISVGVVLKNPEKSKHLETATMKVGKYWIDFVNLRAEEYTEDSRIPDLMRIGTADEDAHRRDLTINALFYNINTGRIEDMTGRGFDDLRRGVIATPLPPLTTLLDDPLRVLRAVRFAARLRFAMDDELRNAARDGRVTAALSQKVARERIGGEVDLMLRSPDPVGAMRLLINLNLVGTVFPIEKTVPAEEDRAEVFSHGLVLLSTTHDHLVDCKISPPVWCAKAWGRDTAVAYGAAEQILLDDEEARRLLWYASFLKPLLDHSKKNPSGGKQQPAAKGKKGARSQGRKANRSVITCLVVDELKRPIRDAEAVEKIMKAADDFTRLIGSGCDLSATAILLGEIRVWYDDAGEKPSSSSGGVSDLGEEGRIDLDGDGDTCEADGTEKERGDCDGTTIRCSMLSIDGVRTVDPVAEEDPVWLHAMEYRLLVSKVLDRVGPLWRAALILSLSEQLAKLNDDELSYTIEGDFMEHDFEEVRRGVIEQYDAFAASFLQLGLMGIWSQKPLIDGVEMKERVLQRIPKGPIFREIMDEQVSWMTVHPGGRKDALIEHMKETFPDFV